MKMKRYEAIEVITKALKGDELVISANGMISRELFYLINEDESGLTPVKDIPNKFRHYLFTKEKME